MTPSPFSFGASTSAYHDSVSTPRSPSSNGFSPLHHKSTLSRDSSSFTVLTPTEENDPLKLLAEIRKWAPVMSCLVDNKVESLENFLDEKITRLMKCQVTSTEEEQYDIIQSLMSLRDGPLEHHTIINKAIQERLDALNEECVCVEESHNGSDYDSTTAYKRYPIQRVVQQSGLRTVFEREDQGLYLTIERDHERVRYTIGDDDGEVVADFYRD